MIHILLPYATNVAIYLGTENVIQPQNDDEDEVVFNSVYQADDIEVDIIPSTTAKKPKSGPEEPMNTDHSATTSSNSVNGAELVEVPAPAPALIEYFAIDTANDNPSTNSTSDITANGNDTEYRKIIVTHNLQRIAPHHLEIEKAFPQLDKQRFFKLVTQVDYFRKYPNNTPKPRGRPSPNSTNSATMNALLAYREVQQNAPPVPASSTAYLQLSLIIHNVMNGIIDTSSPMDCLVKFLLEEKITTRGKNSINLVEREFPGVWNEKIVNKVIVAMKSINPTKPVPKRGRPKKLL